MSKCDLCKQEATGFKHVRDIGWVCEECLGYRIKVNSDSFQSVGRQEYFDGERKKYFNSLVQPFRYGELSKEYVEAYPKETIKMLKQNAITQKEIDNAKYQFKDLPGWETRKNSK